MGPEFLATALRAIISLFHTAILENTQKMCPVICSGIVWLDSEELPDLCFIPVYTFFVVNIDLPSKHLVKESHD